MYFIKRSGTTFPPFPPLPGPYQISVYVVQVSTAAALLRALLAFSALAFSANSATKSRFLAYTAHACMERPSPINA